LAADGVFNGSMKTKLFILTLAAALLAGGLITTKTWAAGSADAVPLRGKILQRIAEKLNLTADQKAQIKTILAGEKDTLKPLLAALHDARKNLRAAIRADGANETSVRAASATVAGAEADLAVERLKLYGKIAPILTAEQRQQISEFEQRADEFVDNAIDRIGDALAN
jgi:Spy/CpxP family protein refolding chaperone